MTIEPVSSMMTAQLQTTAQGQVAKTEAGTEYNPNETAGIAVDKQVMSVQKADEKDKQQPSDQKEKQPSNEQIKRAVEQINKKMQNSEALFGIHEGTNRVTIKIVDKETKEVIKELPPEKTLDMIAKTWELAGLLVDERK